jgi:hypothetical protein
MTDLGIWRAAFRCADRMWPLRGDPTFPRSRRESEGWCVAFESFVAGATRPTDTEDVEWCPPTTVGEAAFHAGRCFRRAAD